MQDAANLAMEHIGGKMAGKQVELIYEDDGFRPEGGKQKSDKLVKQDDVHFVTGFIWSHVLLASRKNGSRCRQVPDLRQRWPVADRRQAVPRELLLDLLAERPDADGDG